jgi:hypothetical protein
MLLAPKTNCWLAALLRKLLEFAELTSAYSTSQCFELIEILRRGNEESANPLAQLLNDFLST